MEPGDLFCRREFNLIVTGEEHRFTFSFSIHFLQFGTGEIPDRGGNRGYHEVADGGGLADVDDGCAVQGVVGQRRHVAGGAFLNRRHGEVQLDAEPAAINSTSSRVCLGSVSTGRLHLPPRRQDQPRHGGGELDGASSAAGPDDAAGEQEVRGGQRRVPAQLNLQQRCKQ